MGKKGKRSRRKAVTAADRASVIAVQTKIKEFIAKYRKSKYLQLNSQATDELRELIQLFEATILGSSETLHKMNLHAWFVETKLISSANLMSIEFGRRNFDGAIQIYKNLFEKGNIKLQMKILSRVFPTLQLQYHEALLRQGKGSIENFISLSKLYVTHSMNYDHNLEIDLRRSADFLRLAKHFDAAIVIGKQLEELIGDTVSLATTYLDQYIVGGKSLPADFASNMVHVLEKQKNGDAESANTATMLVLAQSYYLFHQSSSENTEIMMGKAIGFVEEYLDLISSIESYCITCKQTATESEVQFVCSGCRVACYCSIDHQRMTWKKEAEKGMRFGHEVLCPVMKAYRKWRHANSNGDNERVSRLRRRFERECLYCLSDGLGLRKKCFKK